MPTREGQVRNPAEMIAMGDGSAGPVIEWIGGANSSATINRDAERRHRGRLNMVFVDGHVEDGKVFKWYLSMKAEDLRRWRVDNEAP